jgi:hypothetical protein
VIADHQPAKTMKNEKLQSLGVMVLAVGLGVSPILPAGAQTIAMAEPNKGWSFELDPYAWIAIPSLEATIPGRRSPAEQAVERSQHYNFDTSFSAAFMVAAEIRYHQLGLFMDFAWLRLDTDAGNPHPAFSAVNLKSQLFHATAALTYALPSQGKLHTELLAGARIWNVKEDFETQSGVQPGFTSDGNRAWADPVVGANLSYDLSRHWYMPVRGTVGGFGVSADLTWEVFGGIGYRFNRLCSVTLGYRYLHEDYSRRDFVLNMDVQGPLLGVGLHF